MKVSHINTNFKGIRIAKASIRTNKEALDFDVYKVTAKDSEFLEDFYKKTDLTNLYPNLKNEYHTLWKRIFKNSLQTDKNQQILLLAKDNKPCGVLNYRNLGNSLWVENVCSVPTSNHGKLPWVGATLFTALFRNFLNTQCQTIKLVALKDAPFSNVSKYMRLGFSLAGGDYYNEKMVIDRKRVEKSLNNMINTIEYLETNNEQDINLYSKLQI